MRKACLVDLSRQRPLYTDRNGHKNTVKCEQRVWFNSLKQPLVGISTTPSSTQTAFINHFSLSLGYSISGESEKRTTGKKLRGFVLQPTSLFPVKIALCLSVSCHLSFNHFLLLCTRNSINIIMLSRWGDPVIGMHLILNQGNCFSEDRDKAQPSWQTL